MTGLTALRRAAAGRRRPPSPAAARPAPAAAGGTGPSRLPYPALAALCLALAALTLLLHAAPTYDPWAWIIWGREIAGLELDTRSGPSWKPLPVLFTTLFSVAGDAAPALWLLVARTGALLGVAVAWRLGRRLAGPVAGAVAALMLLLSGGFIRNATLGNSEGLLIGLTLLALERHLDGRRDHALVLAFAAGLLRPEVWPFLGLYGLWLFVRDPPLRRLAVVLGLALPALWLGPELWGSGDALRASHRAQAPNPNSPAFAERPALEVLRLANRLTIWPVKVGALAAAAIALWRLLGRPRAGGGARRAARITLALCAAAVTLVALVAAMTEGGYAGNLRYLALPVALTSVAGGVGLGWIAAGAAALARRARPLAARPAAAALLGAGVVAAAAAPAVAGRLVKLNRERAGVGLEAALHEDLPVALSRAGGRERVLRCGMPATGSYQVPLVAWHLEVHTRLVQVEARPPGYAFRAPRIRTVARQRLEPFTGPRHRRIARTAEWEVLAACTPDGTRSRGAGS